MPPVVSSAPLAQQSDALRKCNEQLRREKKVNRQKVSESAQAILAFCDEELRTDPLIYKVPASENPFIPRKSPCSLL